MARGYFLNALLGGLSGAGKGIAQQQQFRMQQEDAGLDRDIKKFQLAQMQAPTKPKWQYDSERGALVNIETGDVKELRSRGLPDKPVTAKAPEAPHTITTSKGIYQLDPATRKWVPATAPTGEVLTPPKPEKSLSFQTVGGTDGQPPVIIGVDPLTGRKVSEVGLAKPTGSLAKITEAQEKSYLFYNLMKHAEPQITTALGSGKIRPSAVQAYLSSNAVADVPIVGKAIGAVSKPLANANLNADEQQMIRAGKDFAAGVLRKESGAAVTNGELMEVMERYFPGMFGDKPGMTDAKNQARLQYMQTMEQEAGPAIQYYQRQHPTKPPVQYSPNNPFAPRR